MARAESISTSAGMPSRVTIAGESATGLNEWPAPRTRSFGVRDTMAWSSPADWGRSTSVAVNVTLPAQFVIVTG